MAVPKKKTTPSKRGKRRSHDALKPITGFVVCPECDLPVEPHRICDKEFDCYTYKSKKSR